MVRGADQKKEKITQRGFFVENKGQLPNQVLFHTKLNYGDFYIEKGGRFKIKVLDPKKVDDIFGHHHHHNEDHNHARHFKSFTNGNTSNKLINGHVFEVKFIEANFNNSYHSVQKESFKINIFKAIILRFNYIECVNPFLNSVSIGHKFLRVSLIYF